MNSFVFKKTFLVLTIIILIDLVAYNLISFQVTAQDSSPHTLSDYFERLIQSEMPVYIRFRDPIDGVNVGWDVPAEIERDGEVIGLRNFREVGADYVCIGEIGEGLQNIYCVPFSNIAHITLPSLPPKN